LQLKGSFQDFIQSSELKYIYQLLLEILIIVFIFISMMYYINQYIYAY